jgi:hypothetical protein
MSPDHNNDEASVSSADTPSVALVGIGTLLERVDRIEKLLTAASTPKPERSKPFLEAAKIIFGGWPVLGLVFLILFYAPLRDALNAIPEKVRGAEEIGVMGVSLKSVFSDEARKQGLGSLSQVIPDLSPAAIEELIRGSRGYNGMTSWFPTKDDKIASISFPSERMIGKLEELEKKELAYVQSFIDGRQFTGTTGMRKSIADFMRRHPGREDPTGSSDRISWILDKPAPKGDDPRLSWEATDLGKQAVSLILSAVSKELSPPSSAKKAISK